LVARTIGRVPYGVPSLWYNIGMTQDHRFQLTNKQTDKLTTFIDLFYSRAVESPAVPESMKLLLGGVRRAVIDHDILDQIYIDVVLWSLDLVLEQMEENEYDPQMEQLYHKLAGYWPVKPPWYERIKDEPK
jgi:hypothetical protein